MILRISSQRLIKYMSLFYISVKTEQLLFETFFGEKYIIFEFCSSIKTPYISAINIKQLFFT